MRKDKKEAVALRKSGLSYNQINMRLGVPKSTLSYWLKDVYLSKKALEKLRERTSSGTKSLIKRNKQQTLLAEEKYKKLINSSQKEAAMLSKNNLFVAGVCLYWAEGYKKGAQGSKWKCVDFTNSDPQMISLMMSFFRKFLTSDNKKFKVQLIAHKNVNVSRAIAHWTRITKIPSKQFIKPSKAKSVASQKQEKEHIDLWNCTY